MNSHEMWAVIHSALRPIGAWIVVDVKRYPVVDSEQDRAAWQPAGNCVIGSEMNTVNKMLRFYPSKC